MVKNKKKQKSLKISANVRLFFGTLIAGFAFGTIPYWNRGSLSIPSKELLNPPPDINSDFAARYWIASIGLGAIAGAFIYILRKKQPFAIFKAAIVGLIIAAIDGLLMITSHKIGWNIFVPGTMLLTFLFLGYVLFLGKQGKVDKE